MSNVYPVSDRPHLVPSLALALIDVHPKNIRFCGGGALVAKPPTNPNCQPHTPEPTGYFAWHEWAERMTKTHKQIRCPGCGLWAIWTPRDLPTESEPCPDHGQPTEG